MYWSDGPGTSGSRILRTIAETKKLFIYTQGRDGRPKTSIDHVLHNGEPTIIEFTKGYVSHATEWEVLTDHWQIWSKYDIHSPAQSTPKQSTPQKVRWELKLTDRQKVDKFVENME